MWTSPYGFGEPFIDLDEWRETPVRHRYVHGGFHDSHTRFSFYLPPEALYQGRFFQFLQGGAGGSETSLLVNMGGISGAWIFNLAFEELGGYLVESNQGHFGNEGNLGLDGEVELFGASAESALFSKIVAQEMYGSEPHHGYVWGPSGGGLRTTKCLENRPDVWAGGSPHVIGGNGGPHAWSRWVYWWLYCRHRRDDIVDATAPGGSGDPFAALSTREREALAALYRGGWPRGAENALGNFFSWLYTITTMHREDPSYEAAFFDEQGFLGHDEPALMRELLVDQTFTVKGTLERAEGEQYMMNPLGTTAIRVPEGTTTLVPQLGAGSGQRYGLIIDGEAGEPGKNYMARVTVLSGKAAGRKVHIQQGDDGNVLVGLGLDCPELFDDIEPGDQIRLDNRDLIAFGHLWQYSVGLAELTVDHQSDQPVLAPEFRGVTPLLLDGAPLYPQRPAWPRDFQTGAIAGKAIHVCATHDVMVMPSWVPSYQRLVRTHWGDEMDQHYRLWWVENSDHAGPYSGVTARALEGLVAWCEHGVAPPASTTYTVTDDGGIRLPSTADARGGVQPLVQVMANGGVRADVKVGERVTFVGSAQQPANTGRIVAADWDFESENIPWMQQRFVGLRPTPGPGQRHELPGGDESIDVEAAYSYDHPGTFFARLRVLATRHPDRSSEPHDLLIENTATVRIVVSP